MSNVIIKIDTGFVGGEHEYHTGISKEDYLEMDAEDQNEIHNEAIWSYISTTAVDENGEKI